MSLAPSKDLEQRFDGPIPQHLTTTPAADLLAQRGALTMLERMMDEYLDEAERLERQIEEGIVAVRDGGSSIDVNNLEVSRARYVAALRSSKWAMDAVAAKRAHLGMGPHPIMAATALKLAAE